VYVADFGLDGIGKLKGELKRVLERKEGGGLLSEVWVGDD